MIVANLTFFLCPIVWTIAENCFALETSRFRSFKQGRPARSLRLMMFQALAFPKLLASDERVLADVSGLPSARSQLQDIQKRDRAMPRGLREAPGSLAEYLGWLAQASGDGPRAIEDARIDLTRIEPSHFASVRQTCLAGSGVRIRYESMSHPIVALDCLSTNYGGSAPQSSCKLIGSSAQNKPP